MSDSEDWKPFFDGDAVDFSEKYTELRDYMKSAMTQRNGPDNKIVFVTGPRRTGGFDFEAAYKAACEAETNNPKEENEET